MSRNLANGGFCKFCWGKPVLVEEPRAVTEADTGRWLADEYTGMMVANAECPDCFGKYLAWVKSPASWGRLGQRDHSSDHEQPFFDLSFRSTFNDEPGPDDIHRVHPEQATVNRLRREIDAILNRIATWERPTWWEVHYGVCRWNNGATGRRRYQQCQKDASDIVDHTHSEACRTVNPTSAAT